MRGVWAAVVAVLVGAVGFLAYERQGMQNEKQALQARLNAAEARAVALQPKWVLTTDAIAKGTFDVPNAGSKDFKITVDADTMRHVTLSGRFTASGGANNGVEVFVLDDDNFTNWSNGNRASALYQSGRKTVGDIDVALPHAGIYHLAFKSGGIVGRSVEADIALHYDKLTAHQ